MNRSDGKTPEEKNGGTTFPQGNYYRGLDSQKSILPEHFTDHALTRPPLLSSEENFRLGDAPKKQQKSKNNQGRQRNV